MLGTFLSIVLLGHQCLGNRNSNTYLGRDVAKLAPMGKKGTLFIWEDNAVGKGTYEGGRKEDQKLDRG